MDLGRWLKRSLALYRSFCLELLEQKESIVEAIGEGFGKWGRVCYRYPYHVMIASVVACAAMASGLLPPTPVWIDGAEKLYSLPYSRARDDGALHSSYFGDVTGRKNVIILRHEDEGTNILTWKHLEAAQHMDAIIRGKEVDPVGSRKLVIPRTFGDQNDIIHEDFPGGFFPASAGQGRSLQGTQKQEGFMDDRDYMTFEDICLINPWSECAVDSVLKFGLFEMRQMGLLPFDPEVWVFDGTVYNTKQAAFIPEYYLGGTHKEQCWRQLPIDLAKRLLPPYRIKPMSEKPGFALVDIHCIVKAEALMLQYDVDGRAQFEDRNMMWERLFIQILKDNQTFGDLLVSFQAYRSRDDELRASTSESKDVVYVVFTFFILAAYSTCLNFSCDLYRNKLFSALMGFGAAFMGLGAGMGLVSYMGMPMVPTVLICPFLVLGIGVDDMFVVMNCYCVSYTVHDPEERCVQALRISGLGISITTMTNLISFGVGAFSTYMSIRNFCVYSAMALFMGYVFVLTFFFPTLCIDARREECARVCPFCLPEVSDRQKLAQERLNDITQEERRVLDIVGSITLEELVAYKVRVYYEEQAIRAADKRRKRTEGMQRGTSTKNKSGSGHLVRRLEDLFTLRSGPTVTHAAPHVSPVSRTQAQPSRARRLSAASLTSACAEGRGDQRRQVKQYAATAAGTESDQRKARDAAMDKINGTHSTLREEERKNSWSFLGRGPSKTNSISSVDDTGGSQPLLTITIGDLHPSLAREALYEEPRGNVGRSWRRFFLCYYGPILMWLPVKIGVVITFACIVGVSVYGFTKLEMGLELTELAPSNSYMRRFDRDFAMYFNKFDQPTDIFFVDRRKRPGNSGTSDGVAGGPAFQRRSAVQPRRMSRKTAANTVAKPLHQPVVSRAQSPTAADFQLQLYATSSPTLRGGDVTLGGLPISSSSEEIVRHDPTHTQRRRLLEERRAVHDKGDMPGDDDTDVQFIRTEWWDPRVQASIRALHEKIASRPSTSRLVNPLLTMLDDPQLGPKLRMGDKQVFEDTIYYQLVHAKSPYRQFKFDFIWTGRELKTWRMRLLPKYMATSEERAAWMQQLRDDCDGAAFLGTKSSEGGHIATKADNLSLASFSTVQTKAHTSNNWRSTLASDQRTGGGDELEPLYAVPYTYMMVFYESDLGILSSVLINMLSAGLAMLLVAFVLIPEARAGFLVIVMICLIDLALFGFMYFWKVKLHMVSTIALVISIGFAVDYSAHLCHTFTHCKGETREQRAIESLVLMGNPVFHGACSTLLGILLLGFSESFVFSVFFRMMVMVVLFGASHGMILLPVILSWFGPGGTLNSSTTKENKEEDLLDSNNRSATMTPGVENSNFCLPLFVPPSDASPAFDGSRVGGYDLRDHLHHRLGSSSAPPPESTIRITSKIDVNDATAFTLIRNAQSVSPSSEKEEQPVIIPCQTSSCTSLFRGRGIARRYSTDGGVLLTSNSSKPSAASVQSASSVADTVLQTSSYNNCSNILERLNQQTIKQDQHIAILPAGRDRLPGGFSSNFLDDSAAEMLLCSSAGVSQSVDDDRRRCARLSLEGESTRWIQSVSSSGSACGRGIKSYSTASKELSGAIPRQYRSALPPASRSEAASSGATRRGHTIAARNTESSVVHSQPAYNVHPFATNYPRRHSVTSFCPEGTFHTTGFLLNDGGVQETASGIAQYTSTRASVNADADSCCFGTSRQQRLLLLQQKTASSSFQPQGAPPPHPLLPAIAGARHCLSGAAEDPQTLLTISRSQRQESHHQRARTSDNSRQASAEEEETESRISLRTHSSNTSRRTPLRDSRLPPQQPFMKVNSVYRTTENVSSSPPSLASATLGTGWYPSHSSSTSSSNVSARTVRTRSSEFTALSASVESGHHHQPCIQPRRRRSTGGLMASRAKGAVVVSVGAAAATAEIQRASCHELRATQKNPGARQRSVSRSEHSARTGASSLQ